MARAVGEALAELGHLLVEAGTGTGKTFAYLVPALMSGRRIIISTGTRNLQDQLYKRDLPTVTAALGRPVKITLLKGRANYLCRHRLNLCIAGASQERVAAQTLARIQAWAEITNSGDVAEAPQPAGDARSWGPLTSTADNCLGQDCAEYADCHVVKARRAAQGADIVIVNHHLLLADLALKDGGFGEILPGVDMVIVDEAHQVPEVAGQFFGVSVTQAQITNLARDALGESFSIPGATLSGYTDAVTRLARDARLAFGSQVTRIGLDSAPRAAMPALSTLGESLAELSGALDELSGTSSGLDSCARRARELTDRLTLFLAGADAPGDEDSLRWIETLVRGFALHVTPLEPARTLGAAMASRPCGWIFTSATLAVDGDFGHFMARVGLEDAETLRLESPFDFERNALLYLPAGLPEPNDPAFTRMALRETLSVLEASGGRAFLLFTSHRALREAHDWLATRCEFPLLVQGTGSRDGLLRRFRELGNAVLLGSASFWEGVDVRGPALSVVVIDKLPFASPGEPLLQARMNALRARGGNPFREFQLPQAVIALKQGVGRLIRDTDDRGVLMICDPRLTGRSYGRTFLRSLPPMTRSSDLSDVRRFFADEQAGSLEEQG